MNVRSNLDVTPIRPAYEQVANQLRARILDGSMKPGEQLPVEGQLSTSFGVSRTTIREALRTLSSQDRIPRSAPRPARLKHPPPSRSYESLASRKA